MQFVIVAAEASQRDDLVATLQELGVLHVEAFETPEAQSLERAKQNLKLVESALKLTGEAGNEKDSKVAAGPPPDDPLEIARHIAGLAQEKNELAAGLETVKSGISLLTPMGDFDPADFAVLAANNIPCRIYQLSKKALKSISFPSFHAVVGEKNGTLFVLAQVDENFPLPFEPLELPEKGLKALVEEKAFLEEKIRLANEQMADLKPYSGKLMQLKARLEDELAFETVFAGMARHEPVAAVAGYCPENRVQKIFEAGRRHSWAVQAGPPQDPLRVPTKLENPGPVKIINPVLKFMGTTPGYNERDISLWFLVALTLFFAMLVGDGGYGLLFLLATGIARLVKRDAPARPFILFTVFGAATVFWGLVSGTWFGVEAVSHWPGLKNAIVPSLYSFADNQNFLIGLTFTIGAVHLSIAHILRGASLFPDVRFLGELGWLALVWFLYLLAGYFVLHRPMPFWGYYLLGPGVFLGAVFADPKKPFVVSSLLGLADMPLNLVRSFSDVISYVRLFAVGYATLVMAVSFNSMAGDLVDGSLWAYFAAAAVLVIGHSLNILMASLGVLVHGIRLNMLEFSSHMQLSWSGREYSPFRLNEKGEKP
jgi:V/A-type H+-transporting ATPase subunit I